jgi:superfamily II DNA or RNA helicase
MAIGFGSNQSPKVTLREWQQRAKDKCMAQFLGGKRVWVQETVTGGGKTIFGREVSMALYDESVIDLIIILVPSEPILNGWVSTYRGRLNSTSGPIYQSDTQVWVSTYAGYKSICNALASRRTNGYLLIVEEYHHAEREAAWGQAVTTLSRGAKHVLMLSGTPWRTKGTIALLDGERNVHDRPYYQEDGIEPDDAYKYKEDLESDTRGTVVVHFEFVEADAEAKDSGEIYKLPLETDDWRDSADESCKEPLGKYVTITSKEKPLNTRLEGKGTHKEIIHRGLSWLEHSRSEFKQATGLDDVSIMHIACSCINDATSIEKYINVAYPGIKAERIVSDDSNSSKRIEEIQLACKQNSHDRPDVIISVGMISEGVDIPAIKVTVYLNKILTLLYLIQLIGRGQRRVWIDKIGRYADDDNNPRQTMGYFLAPAHPYLIWVASQIEKEIKQARIEEPITTGPGGDGPSKKMREFINNAGDNSIQICSGEAVTANKARLMAAIDKIISSPSANDHLANTMWKEYLSSLIIDGREDAVEAMVKAKCKEMAIKFDDISSAKSVKEELTYDQRCELLSQDAHALIRSIRRNVYPFCNEKDDGIAYPKVWGRMNKLAGITTFSKATLDEKERWINQAGAWAEQQMRAAS